MVEKALPRLYGDVSEGRGYLVAVLFAQGPTFHHPAAPVVRDNSGVLGARGFWLRSRLLVRFHLSMTGSGANSSYLNQAALKSG